EETQTYYPSRATLRQRADITLDQFQQDHRDQLPEPLSDEELLRETDSSPALSPIEEMPSPQDKIFHYPICYEVRYTSLPLLRVSDYLFTPKCAPRFDCACNLRLSTSL